MAVGAGVRHYGACCPRSRPLPGWVPFFPLILPVLGCYESPGVQGRSPRNAVVAAACAPCSESCEGLLVRTTSAISQEFAGRAFGDVVGILEESGFSPMDEMASSVGWQNLYRFSKKLQAIDGSHMSLCLGVDSMSEHARASPEPPRVSVVDVLLVAELRCDYEKALVLCSVPRGNVMDRVLRAEEVREKGMRWPIMTCITAQFVDHADRWGVDDRVGFLVMVEFEASLDREIGGERAWYFVGSAMDSGRTGTGVTQQAQPWMEDGLGDPEGRGGNEWWTGTPPVIESNKAHYLRRK